MGRIDLMQNFSFFEIIEAQAPMVIKALNKVVLNGGRKVIVEVAGENNGKSDKDGKNAAARKEKEKRKEASVAVRKKAVKRPPKPKRRQNLAGKNVAIQQPADRNERTIGNNSSNTKTTARSKARYQTSPKKAGPNERNNLRINNQN